MEDELDEWSTLEYLNIAKHVGDDNLILSHMSDSLNQNLPSRIRDAPIQKTQKTVLELSQGDDKLFDHERILLLDPASPTALSPEDASNYSGLLFGGILGDDPPRDRTKELRVMGFATRHLGPVQMTTDTAVLVAQNVLEGQTPLDKLVFVDRPEIKLGKKEVVEMPFRYLVNDEGNPKLPDGMLELLRKSNEMCLN